ncbi:lytic polysaccharide monooxygenase, partial [Periconia macrospinosa]
ALAATANAHGTVTGVVADGVYFPGYKTDYHYSGTIPKGVVGWSAENFDNGYVGGDQTTYTSPDINCHKNAKPAASSAKVAAGGTVAWQWTAWPDSHIGPVITYAAHCGGDCSAVNKETLEWVKIEEAGYSNGKWAAIAMIATNNTWTTTVPNDLAAGKYVFRHEIIALHGAQNPNGAQSYPQCINIEVTGSGTASPKGTLGSALYTAQDKGILFNPYTGTINYPIPGPALMAGGSSGGSAPAPSASAAASASAAPAPSSAAPAPNSAPSATGAPAPSQPKPAT